MLKRTTNQSKNPLKAQPATGSKRSNWDILSGASTSTVPEELSDDVEGEPAVNVKKVKVKGGQPADLASSEPIGTAGHPAAGLLQRISAFKRNETKQVLDISKINCQSHASSSSTRQKLFSTISTVPTKKPSVQLPVEETENKAEVSRFAENRQENQDNRKSPFLFGSATFIFPEHRLPVAASNIPAELLHFFFFNPCNNFSFNATSSSAATDNMWKASFESVFSQWTRHEIETFQLIHNNEFLISFDRTSNGEMEAMVDKCSQNLILALQKFRFRVTQPSTSCLYAAMPTLNALVDEEVVKHHNLPLVFRGLEVVDKLRHWLLANTIKSFTNRQCSTFFVSIISTRPFMQSQMDVLQVSSTKAMDAAINTKVNLFKITGPLFPHILERISTHLAISNVNVTTIPYQYATPAE